MGRSRAARARMQRVLERSKAKQARIEQAASPAPAAAETVEIPAPAVCLSSYDEARVAQWVRAQVIDWPLSHCLHCRLPLAYGAKWQDLVNENDRARFHADCLPVWKLQQESAGRRAMGLATKEMKP